MPELLPVSQASALRATLLEYLGTTFSLTDPATRSALEEFLTAADGGLFRGPYLRLRLPFRPADEGWRPALEWYGGFPPYGHQAEAFRRLSSLDPATGGLKRPQPTLVTTGTGSGKTESFLYPILDHVLRAKRNGVTGMKALILYPMNALANDQAKRIAELIGSDAALAGVTAGIYTGQSVQKRTRVSADGLINDRAIMRDDPPDILLTNYKMLDQLLLRRSDARLWSASADSLQYLVLDEFHTYDGAQGTDVAMLLRRLGLTLAAHRTPPEHPTIASSVLGGVTPVATSATLGDKGDPTTMLEFARTVFGEEFGPESVVTESRLTLDEWIGDAVGVVAARGLRPIDGDADATRRLMRAVDPDDGIDEMTRIVLAHLYRVPPIDAHATDLADDSWSIPNLSGYSLDELHLLAKAHPLTARLVDGTARATSLSDLATRHETVEYLTAVVNVLSHLRKELGRGALSVDLHLWVRELTRVGRAASGTAEFFWEDDGVRTDPSTADSTAVQAPGTSFPAIYCRHCGRSGWMVALAPTGADLDPAGSTIRRRHLQRDERIRPLIHAPREDSAFVTDVTQGTSATGHPNLRWLNLAEQRLVVRRPASDDTDGRVLPVLTHDITDGGKDSKEDVCPSCGEKDGIRFLGSAIATLLSVTLSGLFGTPHLDAAEKKALIFTDSVQDAAHRAGFVQSRSHALTLRTLMRQAITDDDAVDLDTLVRQIITRAGNDDRARYRLLPPELAERKRFADFWQKPGRNDSRVRNRVEERLRLDVQLEHGLRSGVGRTLETTGSVVAEVDAPRAALVRTAREALGQLDQDSLDGLGASDDELVGWVRGVLEHMRRRGAIAHPWFVKFRTSDGNRWWITGGRRRQDGVPGFGRGNSAPGFPRVGGTPHKDGDLEPITSARGWYVSWTKRCLHVEPSDAASLNRHLFVALARAGVVGELRTESQGVTYHLEPGQIFVGPARADDLAAGRLSLVCEACGSIEPVTTNVQRQLVGRPCLAAFCEGTLAPHEVTEPDFYRQMYSTSDPARVVAREHTSMLEDEVRLAYESAFKSPTPAANAPNVLVATPTLEMGIDIGDLSTVMLSSLPRSVASYLQRVGRAGRLTGNSLVLAFVTARGDQLPRFKDPGAVIDGEVRPPATYLDAEEILRRQYVASIADTLARAPGVDGPRSVADVLGSAEPGTYLGMLIDEAESRADHHLDAFLEGFPDLAPTVAARLRSWGTRHDAEVRASSELAARCLDAARAWSDRVETLQHRRSEIQSKLAELQAVADLPLHKDEPSSEPQQALRTAKSALRLTERQYAELHDEFWIGALEAFGLFPNYTLLDDSVDLDVAISWIDPETTEYEVEQVTLRRGSSAALRDFAPGATFYARGYAIKIDALDLGRGEESIREWTCCAECGFTADVTENPAEGPRACPRCGSAGIADVAQRFDVVELRRVSSVIRREEATIDDRDDERSRESFDIVTMPDIDPSKAQSWFVDGYGFGARYLRQMPVRWLNLGRLNERGQSVMLNGVESDAALFRVCRRCGKLDTSTGRNTAKEHRPWCPQRNESHEAAVSVALARSLVTEGLVLRIPPAVTTGSALAMPSLQAAILLALRERMGGSPDHLGVSTIVDPSLDADNAPALLLYDVVPGGTGYLSELGEPEAVWTMLHRAWEVLRDCSCKSSGVLACERCLLPFAQTAFVDVTSRAEAEVALVQILTAGTSSDDVGTRMPWTVTASEPESVDPETILERLFRAELRRRLTTMGATITEHPGVRGSAWTFRVAGRGWRLEPQVDLHGTRPDFVLFPEDPGTPTTAIYTDGWQFHASPTINRLADDAAKRENLRLRGYHVIALTWADVEHGRDGTPPPWLSPTAISELLSASGSELTPSALSLVERTALDVLLDWIERPDERARANLAKLLPGLFFSKATGHTALPAEADLARLTATWLDNPQASSLPGGSAPTAFWHRGTLAVAMRLRPHDTFEVAMVIDDRSASLGPEHRESWAEWLRISNLLAFRNEIPTTITTRSRLVSDGSPPVIEPRAAEELSAAEVSISAPWKSVLGDALDDERTVLTEMARADLAIPELGYEIEGGEFVIEIAWPQLGIAWDLDLDAPTRERLDSLGWTVVHDLDDLRRNLAL